MATVPIENSDNWKNAGNFVGLNIIQNRNVGGLHRKFEKIIFIFQQMSTTSKKFMKKTQKNWCLKIYNCVRQS